MLYKKPANWTQNQKERAELLFERYPALKQAFELSLALSNIFEKTTDKLYGLARPAKWHEKVLSIPSSGPFTIITQTILNYFDNKSTNASAESFNTKIKAFPSQFRGVRNIEFFFRLTELYA